MKALRYILAYALATLVVAGAALADTPIATHTETVDFAITGSASPNYSIGDSIGGLLSASAVRGETESGTLQSLIFNDAVGESIDVRVWVFGDNPSSSTVTDNAALSIDDADMELLVCPPIDLVVHSLTTAGGQSVATAENIGCSFSLASGSTTLYIAIETLGTNNGGSVNDYHLRAGILQD